MTTARAQQISLADTPYHHIMSRINRVRFFDSIDSWVMLIFVLGFFTPFFIKIKDSDPIDFAFL
jgi:hypothetical protein